MLQTVCPIEPTDGVNSPPKFTNIAGPNQRTGFDIHPNVSVSTAELTGGPLSPSNRLTPPNRSVVAFVAQSRAPPSRTVGIVRSISVVVDEATSPAARDSSPRPLRMSAVVFRVFFIDY